MELNNKKKINVKEMRYDSETVNVFKRIELPRQYIIYPSPPILLQWKQSVD